jgi:hypothetical protein
VEGIPMNQNNIKNNNMENKIIYNQSDIENKNIKVEMNLKLKDIRILSRYLEDELIKGLDSILSQLEDGFQQNEDNDNGQMTNFYTDVYNIFNEMAEIVYRKMVEKEKSIIDSLKKQGISPDGVLEILAKSPDDEERILNIYEAVEDLNFEQEEAENLKKLLPEITRVIIDRLDSEITSLYMPLVIKFVSFLSDTTINFNRDLNEAIFSESALEELLDLDLDALDIFLSKLTKIKVKFGNIEGFLIDDYTIYNNSTVIVYYPIFITNPNEFQINFSKLDLNNLEVSFEV